MTEEMSLRCSFNEQTGQPRGVSRYSVGRHSLEGSQLGFGGRFSTEVTPNHVLVLIHAMGLSEQLSYAVIVKLLLWIKAFKLSKDSKKIL